MRRIITRFLVLSAILLLMDGVGCIIYLRQVQKFQEAQPVVHHAEAAVVLIGDYDEKLHQLGPDSKRRLDHVRHLYQQGIVDWIICAGGARKRRLQAGSVFMKKYLAEQDIVENNILTDSLSYDTETNLAEVQKIIAQHSFHSVVLVSNPLHVYRISQFTSSDKYMYSAYPLSLSNPMDYWNLFMQIHHEWLASIIRWVIPAEYYHQLLLWIRGADYDFAR